QLPLTHLFPYTTLFRSGDDYRTIARECEAEGAGAGRGLRRHALDEAVVVDIEDVDMIGGLKGHEQACAVRRKLDVVRFGGCAARSEEHTSELQSPCNLV